MPTAHQVINTALVHLSPAPRSEISPQQGNRYQNVTLITCFGLGVVYNMWFQGNQIMRRNIEPGRSLKVASLTRKPFIFHRLKCKNVDTLQSTVLIL